MQMMYEVVYKALEEADDREGTTLDAGNANVYNTPQVNFSISSLFGNERAEQEQHSGGDAPEESRNVKGMRIPDILRSLYEKGNLGQQDGLDSKHTRVYKYEALTRKDRRFMIYVYSKGMIVDDEYVILGSANINQRSLEGTRDPEIAMGAYQHRHTRASKPCPPHVQIYGYRMSRWAEHIGGLEECFKQPESIKCVRRVRSLRELNWKQFATDEVTEIKGHFLKYPVKVDRMGKVSPLPSCTEFPDVGGKVTGSIGSIKINENLTI
ncbi:hypothetical protein RHMOL_Rhmol10G0128800 [Rhododendron molle]|uniref:Uncharacterized protein n=1 Tax=Rhododendron molle TaxID=49168 RepID=A0ACC0M3D5_RHOML|nr:hypothetical protein RHMOL_Rhmol10G0128800 [Rhododendron molle]